MSQSTEPSVCAVMLTADRSEMARQAVENFRRQTYPNKRLLIWDSGAPTDLLDGDLGTDEYYIRDWNPLVIGQLRNKANDYAGSNEGFATVDILIHWDDDDYSHPIRIAEQVALLQSSGADCVGYNEMLFWRETVTEQSHALSGPRKPKPGEAWLYSQPNPSYALGTSLCYWRKTWERRPFEATSVGEDLRFTSGLKVAAVSSVPIRHSDNGPMPLILNIESSQPRMVARIHSGNTSDAYRPEAMARASEWKRVPEWDSYCRSVFEK